MEERSDRQLKYLHGDVRKERPTHFARMKTFSAMVLKKFFISLKFS